jgi:hypothetical protein
MSGGGVVETHDPCPGCGSVAGSHMPGCPVLVAELDALGLLDAPGRHRRRLPSWLTEGDDGPAMLGRGLDDE